MDKHEVRRLALLGAAKVAFSATLAGCGGVVIVEAANGEGGAATTSSGTKPVPWETTASSATSSDASTTVGTTSTTGTGIFGGECGVPPIGPYADPTIACCDALLESTFVQDSPTPPNVTPDVVACCNVALTPKPATTTTTTSSGAGLPWAVVFQCCSVSGVSVPKGPACTPWGPPVPPAMPHDLAWLDEAA